MRSLVRRTIVLGLVGGAAVIGSGCEGKQATEYVTGISTQVTVPRDLKAVRVEVSVGGSTQFCRGYKVYDGRVQLPRSLGTFPNTDSSLPITYTIVGLSEDYSDASENPLFTFCASPVIGQNRARILRRSRQPYIPDEIHFIPMPLKFSCFDKACPEDQTCKGGKCVPAAVPDPAAVFPRYAPELADGTGGTCFRSSQCMAAALPAITVDPVTCAYAVPNTPSAPPTLPGQANPFTGPSSGSGVNVEVLYDGGLVREVLDLDPEEGFSVPDPANPQRFKLADGLCEMVKGKDAEGNPTAHRISAIRASGTCQSKRIIQPICAGDQLAAMGLDPSGVIPNPPPVEACSSVELVPPQAALMVVVDETTEHKTFFDALKKVIPDDNSEDKIIEPAIRGALSDPALQRTDLGLFYSRAGLCAATGAPVLPVGLAPAVRDQLLEELKNHSTSPGPVALEGALSRAYNELKLPKYDLYFRRAVLVLGNGGFNDAGGCPTPGGPIDRAQDAAGDVAKPIQTYVIQLPKDPAKSSAADALAVAGQTGQSAWKALEATNKFAEIVSSLATCVYDVDPARAPLASDAVAFADPLSGIVTKLGNNPACSAEDAAGAGWGSAAGAGAGGKTRVYLCKDSCTAYRDVLRTVTTFTALYSQPALPVPVFAYRATCE